MRRQLQIEKLFNKYPENKFEVFAVNWEGLGPNNDVFVYDKQPFGRKKKLVEFLQLDAL